MNSKNKFVSKRDDKTSYKTCIMKVPEPLKEKVQYLIYNYIDYLIIDNNKNSNIILLT
jgi:hypothetical protein